MRNDEEKEILFSLRHAPEIIRSNSGRAVTQYKGNDRCTKCGNPLSQYTQFPICNLCLGEIRNEIFEWGFISERLENLVAREVVKRFGPLRERK